MTKRPQSIPDNEEKLADAEESRGPHRSHHHSLKHSVHVNRHHKKNDKIADRVTNATTESVATASGFREVSTEGNAERRGTTVAETTTTESSVTSSSAKPKKSNRNRPRIKESSANRTETEEDKPPQRRRKPASSHHQRRNNTLFTNSVHDAVTHANANETGETTRDPMTVVRDRYESTTTAMTDVARQRISGADDISDDDAENRTTVGSIAITEPETTTVAWTRGATEVVSRTRPTTGPDKGAGANRSRNNSAATSAPTTRKYPKVQKNRTSGILKPARIDVTILEGPDKKHKHGRAR